MRASVIIPTLNEEEHVGAAIDSALEAGAREVLVSDAGSTDATVAIAREHGARVIVSERMRARQLNRAASEATGEMLLFLHADTRLPRKAIDVAAVTLRGGAVFGGFRLRFLEGGWRLRYVQTMVNARTRITRAPWGDQAQFTTRDAFTRVGGYPDYPLMEDYELARRMKRLGTTVLLPLYVETSGRRFLAKGVVRTSIVNWSIVAAYHAGVSPERLAKWYRG